MRPVSGLWGVLVPLGWLAVVYLARNSELGTRALWRHPRARLPTRPPPATTLPGLTESKRRPMRPASCRTHMHTSATALASSPTEVRPFALAPSHPCTFAPSKPRTRTPSHPPSGPRAVLLSIDELGWGAQRGLDNLCFAASSRRCTGCCPAVLAS